MDLLPKSANHYDFSCRICLQQTLEMFSLFECRDSVIVYEEVMFCTNVTIQKGDNFPESICKECLGELNTAAQFKRKSEQSDTILKGFVQNFKHEIIKIEFEPEILDSNAANSSYDELSDEDCKPLKSFLKTKKNNTHKSKVKKLQQNHSVFQQEKQATTECERTLLNVEEKTDINISDDLVEEYQNKSRDDVDIIEKEVKIRQKKYKKAIKPNKKKDKRISSIADLTCETCNLKCQTKWALKVHMRTHSGERPFQCDICLKRYVSNSNMRTHKRLTHDEEKQVCAKCGKSFSCLTYLKRHQVTHLEVKPHACAHCPRRFSTRAYLREHAARHRGDRRFCCEACGASFVSDVNLKQHMVTHGVLKWDFKRHQCTFCEYRTTGRVALARHVRKHTGEKPFLCSHDGCQSAFAGKASLLLHIRIHTGEKPYSCSECPAKFSRSDKHKNHMLKKHNINSVGPNKRSRLIIQELVDRQQTSLGPT